MQGIILSILLQSPICENPILYAVTADEGFAYVYLNPLKHWEEAKTLADGYSDEEREVVELITEENKLCEEMESIYSDCTGEVNGKEAMLEKLSLSQNPCLMFLPEFQSFIEGENL